MTDVNSPFTTNTEPAKLTEIGRFSVVFVRSVFTVMGRGRL